MSLDLLASFGLLAFAIVTLVFCVVDGINHGDFRR